MEPAAPPLLLLFFQLFSLPSFSFSPPVIPFLSLFLSSLHLSIYPSGRARWWRAGGPSTYLPVVLLTPHRPITLRQGVGGGHFKGISTIFDRKSPGRRRVPRMTRSRSENYEARRGSQKRGNYRPAHVLVEITRLRCRTLEVTEHSRFTRRSLCPKRRLIICLLSSSSSFSRAHQTNATGFACLPSAYK